MRSPRRRSRSARRDHGAGRPERGRQVDADQGADRRLSRATAARSTSPAGRSPSPRRRRRSGRISTIYQEINLVPFRSVTENIFLGRERRRFGLLDWRRMNAEAAEMLRRFDVVIDVRRPLMEFRAIQQMVAMPAPCRSRRNSSSWTSRPPGSTSAKCRCCSTSCGAEAQGRRGHFITHRLDELFRSATG